MAILSNSDRFQVTAQWMRDNAEQSALSKAQLRAAIDAADNWIDGNAASYNDVLPAAARTALTASQKARLLTIVIQRRFEVS